MCRPKLTAQTPVAEFLAFYWLKAELLDFCRAQGLPASGSKQALTRRIEAYLTSGDVQPAERHGRRAGRRPAAMPAAFTPATVIEEGWRCSQALRAFLEQELGPAFHFDAVMRDLVYHGAGRTLQTVMGAWRAEQRQPNADKDIGAQFEYNRHIRDYFKAHPGAKLSEAIRAWQLKKRQRQGEE